MSIWRISFVYWLFLSVGVGREFNGLASGLRKGENFLPLSLPNNNSPAVQPVAWSLHWLSYPKTLTCNHLSTILKWGLNQFNQLANQPDSQSVIHSVSQSFSHSVTQSLSQSVNQLVSQSFSQSVIQTVSHSVSKSAIQSASHSYSQSVNQSVSQSFSHSVSQPVSHSVSHPVSQSNMCKNKSAIRLAGCIKQLINPSIHTVNTLTALYTITTTAIYHTRIVDTNIVSTSKNMAICHADFTKFQKVKWEKKFP
jgi:hypothetical protein